MYDFSNFSKYWRENALNESYLLHLAVYSIINKCFRLKGYGQIVICKFKAFYHVIYANLIFPSQGFLIQGSEPLTWEDALICSKISFC